MKRTAIFVLVVAISVSANAYLLDWTTVDYTSASVNEDFLNVGGSGVNMNFDWRDPSSSPSVPATPSMFTNNLPDDEDALVTYPGAEPGLWYATDNSTNVSLLITFSDLVTNVSFGIYDIDGRSYNMESVRIKFFDENGDAVDVMNYWTALSVGTDIETVIGDTDFGVQFISMGADDTDPGDADYEKHKAIIGIDNVGIKSIGIAFVNNDGNRGQILTDIAFVPEPATMILLGLGSVALLRKKR